MNDWPRVEVKTHDLGEVNLQPKAPTREDSIRETVKTARQAIEVLCSAVEVLRCFPELTVNLEDCDPQGIYHTVHARQINLTVSQKIAF